MKKILLGTSALIGAATLLSGAALADDPKVTVGGFNTFEGGYSEGSSKGSYNDNLLNRAFRNDTEIHFNVAGKSDAGLNYGAEIDLNADINGAGSAAHTNANNNTTSGLTNNGIVAHRTYGWLGGDAWGHFEMGSNDGVARTMKVDASNIARATGGIDGDWIYFANANSSNVVNGKLVGTGSGGTFTGGPTGVGSFITAPRLPVEQGPATGFATELWSNDNKVSYYSPKVYGFQLGGSYATDLQNRGELTNRAEVVNGTTPAARDIFEGGLSYDGQFDQFGFAAALTGETGHAENGGTTTGYHNLEAWNGGAKVSYMGFSLAGSYGDWDNSFAPEGTAGQKPEASYWTAGGGYEYGPFGASVTYLNSDDKVSGYKDKFQDVSTGIDYKLAPGLTPFVEWTYYEIKPDGTGYTTVDRNKGNVVMIGSQLSF